MFHNRNKIILHLIYKKEREGEGERERERERERMNFTSSSNQDKNSNPSLVCSFFLLIFSTNVCMPLSTIITRYWRWQMTKRPSIVPRFPVGLSSPPPPSYTTWSRYPGKIARKPKTSVDIIQLDVDPNRVRPSLSVWEVALLGSGSDTFLELGLGGEIGRTAIGCL